ncbi:MAG: hypothetical protein ACOCZ8_03260 [Bacteroidota bacterium]
MYLNASRLLMICLVMLPISVSAQNVGIGLADPQQRLHVGSTTDGVAGDQRVRIESQGLAGLEIIGDTDNDPSEPGGAFISLSQDDGIVTGLIGTVQTPGENPLGGTLTNSLINAVVMLNTNISPIQFGTDNTIRMSILPSGDVGVNTTAPEEKLDVDGNVNVREHLFSNSFSVRNLAAVYASRSPDRNDDATHTLECPDGYVMTNLIVRASDRWDDELRCNCVELESVLTTNHRWTPNQTGDDREYQCECDADELITGWRVYASSRLDRDLSVRCTEIQNAIATAPVESFVRSHAGGEHEDDIYHYVGCPPGTYPRYFYIYTSSHLDRNGRFFCVGLRPD